jgi:hypothetical protein
VGGEAGDLAAFLIEIVDGFEGAGDDVVDAGEAAGDSLLGDFEEGGFGSVEDFESLFTLIGGAGDGAGADVDELAEEGFVLTMRTYSSMERRRGRPSVREANQATPPTDSISLRRASSSERVTMSTT